MRTLASNGRTDVTDGTDVTAPYVNRVDLYYLHRVHDDVGIEDSLEVIVRERDRGRIAHIGVST
jgi:diketogulonate reductase-like aldo/keto reductase